MELLINTFFTVYRGGLKICFTNFLNKLTSYEKVFRFNYGCFSAEINIINAHLIVHKIKKDTRKSYDF